MKGRISLTDFIKEVKADLVAAQDEGATAFYELTEVTLEVSFTLDVTGKGGAKFFVVDVGGEAKAGQVHKVVLKLLPLKKPLANQVGEASASGFRAGHGKYFRPTYGPSK